MNFDFDLLVKTYLYIVKKLQRDKIRKYGSKLNGFLLDVGCGRGAYRKYLDCERYIGLDINIQNCPSIVASAMVLPFRDNIFDSVLCTEVLEHLNEPERCLKEIYRVLKPEGVGLITIPMSWNLHYEPNDYYRFTKYGLCYLLEKHGFQVLELERVGGLFSLIGSRFVDTISMFAWRKLKKLGKVMPYKLRHAIVLCFSIPFSILFYVLALLLDRMDSSDAVGWLVVFRKGEVL